MSTVESFPQSPAPAQAAELIEAGAMGEPSPPRATVLATLPVRSPTPAPAATRSAAPAVRPATALLGSLREAAGQLIPQVQYQLSRLGVAGQAGLGAVAAAAALVIGAVIPLQHALQQLQLQVARPEHALVGPGLAPGVPGLVASLPTRGQIPAVIGQIYNQAQTAGVALSKGHYAYVPPKTGAVGRYEVEFPVAAAYPAIRTFINGSLTAVPAASLGKLRIERKAVGEQLVNADIGFIVFVRGEGQP
ncbi:MAG: hypothetical protein JO299_12205 [Gammaproteobacteria bacterium]|nr:hypothetical protein [Gammaproteobacteria bacterium]